MLITSGHLRNYFLHILSKSDFNSMLTSDTIESAIKTIVEKPIGMQLYEVVRGERFSLGELYKVVDKYNADRVNLLKRSLDGEYRLLIESFEKLFDVINLWSILFNLVRGRKPAIIYPFGRIYSSKYIDVKSVDELYGVIPDDLIEIAKHYIMYGVENLESIVRVLDKIRDQAITGFRVRKVYGFIRDSLLLRFCMALEHKRDLNPSTIVLTSEEYSEACNAGSLKDLASIIRGFNPLYSGFSELLEDLFRIMTSYELFDLGILLYAISLTTDLISSDQELLIRIYLMYGGETLLVKVVLGSIHSELFKDELKSIIQRWWPI